jgi:hypothetical protein
MADDEAGDGGEQENGPVHLLGGVVEAVQRPLMVALDAALAGAGVIARGVVVGLESASAGRVPLPP